MKRKVISAAISLAILTATPFNVMAMSKNIKVDSWAQKDIDKLNTLKLIPESLEKIEDLRTDVTREEFADIMVQVYLTSTKQNMEQMDKKAPFLDTESDTVAVAYNLGVIKGTSDITFNPKAKITRQDMATMICRELNILNYKTETAKENTFSDKAEISDYAKNSINFVHEQGIIKGKENNKMKPRDNTTRQEALIIENRMVNRFSLVEGADPTMVTPPAEPVIAPITPSLPVVGAADGNEARYDNNGNLLSKYTKLEKFEGLQGAISRPGQLVSLEKVIKNSKLLMEDNKGLKLAVYDNKYAKNSFTYKTVAGDKGLLISYDNTYDHDLSNLFFTKDGEAIDFIASLPRPEGETYYFTEEFTQKHLESEKYLIAESTIQHEAVVVIFDNPLYKGTK